MTEEEHEETLDITVTFNGKTLSSESLPDLIYDLEAALKNASILDYGDSLEILSSEASAVASKCGY